MAKNAATTELPGHGKVIGDPDAIVNGQTLTQWTENYVRWAFASPAGQFNALNDPTGLVANDLNSPGAKMFFVTGAPSNTLITPSRSFNVHTGQSILVPVDVAEDSEAPSNGKDPPAISPTRPDFQGSAADQVKAVLADFKVTNVYVTLDNIDITHELSLDTHPLLVNTGIFSAGVVQAGTFGEQFFGSLPGTSLATSGVAGEWLVLKDLTPGKHTLTTSSDHVSPDFGGTLTVPRHSTHTDVFNVTPGHSLV